MQRHTEYAEQQSAVDHEAMRRGIHLVWSRGREASGSAKPEQQVSRALSIPRFRSETTLRKTAWAEYAAQWWMRCFGIRSDPADG